MIRHASIMTAHAATPAAASRTLVGRVTTLAARFRRPLGIIGEIPRLMPGVTAGMPGTPAMTMLAALAPRLSRPFGIVGKIAPLMFGTAAAMRGSPAMAVLASLAASLDRPFVILCKISRIMAGTPATTAIRRIHERRMIFFQ
ncbi:hypothetical protein GCM10023157_13410 [Gluconacetobacter asukensis]